MAISTRSTLANSHRFFTIAVNHYDGKKIKGILAHAGMEEEIAFSGLIDLVWQMEQIFDEMQYPARSVQQRKFRKVRPLECGRVMISDIKTETAELKGTLGTFRVQVFHRYYATWQGTVWHQESGKSFRFQSFLEFVRYLDLQLADAEPEYVPEAMGKTACRIAVDESDRHELGGRLFHSNGKRLVHFDSVMELMRQMDGLFTPNETISLAEETGGMVLPDRALGEYKYNGKIATFVVRLLFRENASWQGVVYWKESGEEMHFRSFLELVMLMDAAAFDLDAWKDAVTG